MAREAVEQGSARRGSWQPYALLTPGMLWLVLFFVAPMVVLGRYALSERENRFTLDYEFAWKFSNFPDAFDEYGTQFLRSFRYAGIATVLCILLGYPLAYFIATRGGRFKSLLLGLVVVPFFTSYLVRTIAWTTLLGDNGPILGVVDTLNMTGALDAVGITDEGRLLQTQWAVIGGLTYNFLPFMVLPIYVSLEKIDLRLVDAAKDLYSSSVRAFWKVVFPLSMPGVFAGTLLTFVPASGDFVNAEFLGGPRQQMIGNAVQREFFEQSDFSTAASISFVLMAIITVGVLLYARLFGTEDLTT
jgi:spermidine/putrescine transport system permease protein